MLVYLDSSAFISTFIDKKIPRLLSPSHVYVSSDLLRVEAFRVLLRYKIERQISDEVYGKRMRDMNRFFEMCNLIPLREEVIVRALKPFNTYLRTLDALHMATLLYIEEVHSGKPALLSLDKKLSLCAESHGFKSLD